MSSAIYNRLRRKQLYIRYTTISVIPRSMYYIVGHKYDELVINLERFKNLPKDLRQIEINYALGSSLKDEKLVESYQKKIIEELKNT